MPSSQETSRKPPQGERASHNGMELQLSTAKTLLAMPHHTGSIRRGPRHAEACSGALGVSLPSHVHKHLVIRRAWHLFPESKQNHKLSHMCRYTPADIHTAILHRVSLHTPAARFTSRWMPGAHMQGPLSDPSLIYICDATLGLEHILILKRL